ncbi:uncharacterized protein [Montipora capricornis]|uniref:uncharacterized protein n=1 Tax=Montipora capricornis TaxID=246305 RepID=UPI0035F19EEF
MALSKFAAGDVKNAEESAFKSSSSGANVILDDQFLSPLSRGNDISIPEIGIQQYHSETDRHNQLNPPPDNQTMCASLRKTTMKISSCGGIPRKLSDVGAVSIPDKDKLRPDERDTMRRKRSLSLDPQILLQWATTHNDIDTLKSLLESTTLDVNQPGVDGFYPLHRAASTGSLQCLQYLVTKGAQLEVRDNDGSSPLDAAVSEGEFDCARFLIEKGANISDIRDGFTDKDLIKVRRIKRAMTIM